MSSSSRRDDVQRILEAHCPGDEVERDHLAELQALLSMNDRDVFDWASFVPGHITASAFVLSPDRSELLMIYHGKLQRWLQPGGHVESGDTSMEAAAIREVWEETGVRLSPSGILLDIDVHSIPARRENPEHRHYDIRFLFQATARDDVHAGDDAAEAEWVHLSVVNERASDASVLRPVEKLRRQTSGQD